MVSEASDMHTVEFSLVLAFQLHTVLALTCFWCSGVDNDRMCETRPRKVSSFPAAINCSTRFCISTKVMDAVTGSVRSFARSCDHIPRGNECVKDFHFVTCYETCTFDLCNSGNPDPSYLPTRSYSGLLLQLSEVFGVENTTPRVFNNKKFYKQLSDRPDGWKNSSYVNRTLSSGNYPSKFGHERGTSWKDHEEVVNGLINGLSSFKNLEISNYAATKSLRVKDKGRNSINESAIPSYPFSSFAEMDENPKFADGNPNVHLSTTTNFQPHEQLWWRKPKHGQTDTNKAVDTVQMNNNNLYQRNKNTVISKDNIRHEHPQAFSVSQMGDKHVIGRSENNFSHYFPVIRGNVPMTLTSAAQITKPLQKGDKYVNYANPVASHKKRNLVKWWEQADHSPVSDRPAGSASHHTSKLSQPALQQSNASSVPEISAGSGDSVSQLVQPLLTSQHGELPRDINQYFVVTPGNSKSDEDEGTNWQHSLPRTKTDDLNRESKHSILGGARYNGTFEKADIKGERGPGQIQPLEPFRATLGNLCRPVTTGNRSLVIPKTDSCNLTADYGFSTGSIQTLNLPATTTVSRAATMFTAEPAGGTYNTRIHTSPNNTHIHTSPNNTRIHTSNNNANTTLLGKYTPGLDTFTASHYIEFEYKPVHDEAAGKPDMAFGHSVFYSERDRPTSKAESQLSFGSVPPPQKLPDSAPKHSEASVQNFPHSAPKHFQTSVQNLQHSASKHSETSVENIPHSAHKDSEATEENLSDSAPKHSEASVENLPHSAHKDSEATEENLSDSAPKHSEASVENLPHSAHKDSEATEENLSDSAPKHSEASVGNLPHSAPKHSETSVENLPHSAHKDSEATVENLPHSAHKDSEATVENLPHSAPKHSETSVGNLPHSAHKDSEATVENLPHSAHKHSETSVENLAGRAPKHSEASVQNLPHNAPKHSETSVENLPHSADKDSEVSVQNLPHSAPKHSEPSVENLPELSTTGARHQNRQSHENPQERSHVTAPTQDPGSHLKSSLYPDASTNRTIVHEENTKTRNFSTAHQNLTERDQDSTQSTKVEGRNLLEKESSRLPNISIKREDIRGKHAQTANFSIAGQTFPDRNQGIELTGKIEDRNSLDKQSILPQDIITAPTQIYKHQNKTKYFSSTHQAFTDINRDTESSGKIGNHNSLDHDLSIQQGDSSKSTLIQEKHTSTTLFSSTQENSTDRVQDTESTITILDENSSDISANNASYEKLSFNKINTDKQKSGKSNLDNSNNDKYNSESLFNDIPNHYTSFVDKSKYFNASYDKLEYVKLSYDKSSYTQFSIEKHADGTSNFVKHEHNESNTDKRNYKTPNYDKSNHHKFNQDKSNLDKSSKDKPSNSDDDVDINQTDRWLRNVSRPSDRDTSLEDNGVPDMNSWVNATIADEENIQKRRKSNLIRLEPNPYETDTFTNTSTNIDSMISNFTTLDKTTSNAKTQILAKMEKKGMKPHTSLDKISHIIDELVDDKENIINITLASKRDKTKTKTDTQEADFGSLHRLTTRYDIKTKKQRTVSNIEVEAKINKNTLLKDLSENFSKDTLRRNEEELKIKLEHNSDETSGNQYKLDAPKSYTRIQNTAASKKQVSNLTDVGTKQFKDPGLVNEGATRPRGHNKAVGVVNRKHGTKRHHLLEKKRIKVPYNKQFSRSHQGTEKSNMRSSRKSSGPNYEKQNNNEGTLPEKRRAQQQRDALSPKAGGDEVLESTGIYRNKTKADTGNDYNTTNKMAAKSHRTQTRMPRQRIYLRRNVHKPGWNEKLQSESKTVTFSKNSSSGMFNMFSGIWLVLLLTSSVRY